MCPLLFGPTTPKRWRKTISGGKKRACFVEEKEDKRKEQRVEREGERERTVDASVIVVECWWLFPLFSEQKMSQEEKGEEGNLWPNRRSQSNKMDFLYSRQHLRSFNDKRRNISLLKMKNAFVKAWIMFSEPFIRFVFCRCSCINSHFLQKPQNPLRRDDFLFSCSENISIWSTKHFSKHHCYCCTWSQFSLTLFLFFERNLARNQILPAARHQCMEA